MATNTINKTLYPKPILPLKNRSITQSVISIEITMESINEMRNTNGTNIF